MRVSILQKQTLAPLNESAVSQRIRNDLIENFVEFLFLHWRVLLCPNDFVLQANPKTVRFGLEADASGSKTDTKEERCL
jgi:hypothetical protein